MIITIFVRHASGCKYRGDEFAKQCRCKKHFRWSQGGKQFRRTAGTRSWAEAEENKRRLEDQLAGRVPAIKTEGQFLTVAIDTFTRDKEAQGIKPHGLKQ